MTRHNMLSEPCHFYSIMHVSSDELKINKME